MKKKYIFFLIITLCLLACVSKNKFYSLDDIKVYDAGKVENIKGTCMSLMNVENAVALRCVGKYLLALCPTSDSIVKVYDSKDLRLLSAFGTIGHSKNEFTQFPINSYIRMDNAGNYLMYVSDVHETKVVNLSVSISKGTCVVDKVINHGSEDFGCRRFLGENDDFIIYHAFGAEGDARENIFHTPFVETKKDGETEKISYFPEMLDGESNKMFLSYRTMFDVKPDMTKCVEIFACQDLFTIINLEQMESLGVSSMKGNYFMKIQEVMKDGSFKDFAAKTKVYNMNYCLTDNYIFLLCDGEHSAVDIDKEKVLLSFKPEVRVFDWDGNFKTSFRLDKCAIVWIEYSESAGKLFCLDLDNNIYSYNISKYI